ncbi:MAG: isoleucine--tRNA ligase, partial [Armatimonadetes bacterium CG_4_8_14_3_um_filter_66_20]
MSDKKPAFPSFEGSMDYPAMEHRVLDFWKENRIFEKRVEKNRGNEVFSFYDGPMTANNPMGVHHAWGRTYKDIAQRYKAMLGFDQRYQNGFDCQGLWVEVEVEKDLGLNSKRDILAYGLDNFSRKCRERVEKYSGIQAEQSIRLGQWMEWDNSYFTMTDTNIEYIWHFLKTCYEKGWLYLGHRSMPWCVRCGTSLSQHELIDSYRELEHTSVFLKLPLLDAEGERLMVWTTTPWTLTSNTACAVHPEFTYAKVRQHGEVLYLSAGTLSCLSGEYERLGEVKGADLVGRPYRGPFHDLPAQAEVETRIVAWGLVGEEEGTGVVHIAPGCGAEDFDLSKELGLSVLVPIDDNGTFVEGFGWLTGQHVQGVAQPIFEDLEKKGVLYKLEDHEHRYPVCWRCSEELVFRLVDEWFIRSDEVRPVMIREVAKVRWVPEHAGKRMEDWLNNMGDWCISRKRFWGLPLPFYPCQQCGEMTVVGSRAELEQLACAGLDQLQELHRPWIDAVQIVCPTCSATVTRLEDVGDCWLDAGIIPFSTLGYLSDDRSYWEKWFPAEFITEMREQIRLWFYSMLFMGVTLEGQTPYRNVLTYEKMNDEHGKPMHKSHGNAIWFDAAAERMGADVMRWIYAQQSLYNNLNFGYGPAEEVKRKLATLWNVLSFFTLYANLDQPALSATPAPDLPRTQLDKWILARLQQLIEEVTESLDSFQPASATRSVEAFLEDLSNWYVRRNRRRFWKSESDADKQAAYQTLWDVLSTLAKLVAPILPFSAETIYQGLVRPVDPDAPESVHLCDYPQAQEALKDGQLVADTATVMRVVSLGRAARVNAQLKVRQPLAKVFVKVREQAERDALARLQTQVLEELNVKALQVVEDETALRTYSLKPNFGKLGPKYGKLVQAIRAA